MKTNKKAIVNIIDLSKLLAEPIDEIKRNLVNTFNIKEHSDTELLTLLLLMNSKTHEIIQLEKNSKAAKNKDKVILLKKWFNREYEEIAHAFFLNAFKWSLLSKKWEKQADVYQKKFITKSLNYISESLEKKDKTTGLDYFLKIIFLYSIELIFKDATDEDLQQNMQENIELALILKQIPESKNKILYEHFKEQGWNKGYEDFIEQISLIKTYFGSEEIIAVFRSTSLADIIDELKNSIYDAEEPLFNIDNNRIVDLEELITDGLYSKLKESDTLFLSLIYALNDYRKYLIGIRRNLQQFSGLTDKISFVNIEVYKLLIYMIKAGLFYERDMPELNKIFNGEKPDKKVIMNNATNVFGTILYELHEAGKIKNSKDFLCEWMETNFFSKSGKNIGHAYIVKLLTRVHSESNRLSEYSKDYIDISQFL